MRLPVRIFGLWALLLLSFAPAHSQRPFPVVHDDMSQSYTTGTRPWQRPSYSEKDRELSAPFQVPDSFRKRVDFWKAIYSQYSTWQGVLHNVLYPWVVYRVVDFSDIELQEFATSGLKERARRERVEQAKKEVAEVFEQMQKSLAEGEELTGEALSIHRQMESIEDEHKFKEAGNIDRIRFQLGQRDRFLQGIYYAGRYIEEMERIFESEGLPRELTRLPMVESSFNIFAQSRVGASGLWQIMPRVGREMKLKVNSTLDERNDPLKATRAAARILKNNYRLLEDWPLALTGYNHGVYGVRRRLRASSATNLFELVQQRGRGSFGFASKNFYASFVAAVEVELWADQYFENVRWSQPLPQVAWDLPQVLSWKSLLEAFDGQEETARIFNPHLTYRVRQGRVNIPRGTTVYIPRSAQESMVAKWSQAAPAPRTSGGEIYRVRPGDTLSGIAARFGFSQKELQELNGIDRPSSLKAGDQLRLPVREP